MDQMIDIPKILLSLINLPAVICGIAVLEIVKRLLPTPEGGEPAHTIPGHWGTRLLPFVPIFTASVVTIALEWDGKFAPMDVVRGVISGQATELIYRIYNKTIKGV
jgi:hypothetical protein